MLFEELVVWRDLIPRSGPENMAIDCGLLTLGKPVLRLYEWAGDWVSYGSLFRQRKRLGRNLVETCFLINTEVRRTQRGRGGMGLGCGQAEA